MGKGEAHKSSSEPAGAHGLNVGELAHDLRNLVGLVRALAEELPTRMRPIDVDGDVVLRDLQAQSLLAMDALLLLEKWSNGDGPARVSLGAWAWALRLRQREVALGERVAYSAYAQVSVPALMSGGAAVVTALGRGGGGAVRVDADEQGAVVFEGVPGSADQDALDAACGALSALGLRVTKPAPYTVRVAPAANANANANAK